MKERRIVATSRKTAGFPARDAYLQSAWAAWKGGDVLLAEKMARRLLLDRQSVDAGHLMLALVRHTAGDHTSAISHFETIDPAYRWRRVLVEPMIWSYVAAGDREGAIAHVRKHRQGRTVANWIRLAAERPLGVTIDGVVVLPFVPDELSAWMPGISGTLNGRRIVARLDTGGSYLHLSADAAERFGIETIGCDRGFASLSRTRVCYGVADLELGPIAITNAPVAVHERGLSAAPLAKAFGAPMDAIIGTNILEQFLATIDGPSGRMILSARGDEAASREHRLLVNGSGVEVPFGIWTSHLMIAPGTVSGIGPMNLFVDSGLVMVTPEQGQASLLISSRGLDALDVPRVRDQLFTPVPGQSGLSGAARESLLAFPVKNRTWAGFGDWGGMDVAALVGWGYLKRFVWTIDFDRRVYTLSPPTER